MKTYAPSLDEELGRGQRHAGGRSGDHRYFACEFAHAPSSFQYKKQVKGRYFFQLGEQLFRKALDHYLTGPRSVRGRGVASKSTPAVPKNWCHNQADFHHRPANDAIRLDRGLGVDVGLHAGGTTYRMLRPSASAMQVRRANSDRGDRDRDEGWSLARNRVTTTCRLL